MEQRAAEIRDGKAAELVWLVEHPPLYTAGTSAEARPDRPRPPAGLQDRPRRRIHLSRPGPARGLCDARPQAAARGRARLRGGAGSLDHRRAGRLQRQGRAPRGPRRRLGGAAGQAAARGRQPAEDKIAAIGISLRRWVSFHGIALNVEPDLSHFSGIVPCGVTGHGVTSLVDLGLPVTMPMPTRAARAFVTVFGPVASGDARLWLAHSSVSIPVRCACDVETPSPAGRGRRSLIIGRPSERRHVSCGAGDRPA